ncbi:hypothetical protein KC678_00005, partial [Candidatus Dojkabacteria bacterium]|nr:hypothetical protein [Candidatus Dojkabacteria bacterium]
FMIALLIISLVVSYLVFSFRFEDVEAYFSNYFKNWKGVFKKNVALNLRIHRALKLLAFPLYFALPLFIIVLAIQLISGDSLGTIWQPYATLYSRSFDQINTDFVTLLIGTGAGSVAYNGGTLFSQIISANGLIGIVAYALIFSFGIYQSIKRICNINIRGHRFLVDFVASIYVMLIPIMGIVITEVEPTATRNNMNLHIHYFFLMIIWWICLAIVSGLNKNNIVEFTVNRIRKGKTKFARLLVKIFALTLFLISYILIYTVLKNVGTLL